MDFFRKKYSEQEIKEFLLNGEKNFNYYQDLYNLSMRQNLSEDFIKEFKDKLEWDGICRNTYITLSDEFVIEFDDRLRQYSECSDGDYLVDCYHYWMINYQYHRILGPARIFYNGNKEYYYRGKQIEVNSDEEYFEWLKYKDF